MTPLVISFFAFLTVASLVGVLAFVFRDQTPQAATRLDLLVGKRRREDDTKADILRNAIDLVRSLGREKPKVAILAAVETVTTKMPATIDAAALCKMADRGQITDAMLDGPLAFDNAVEPEAARIKGIHSPVAGRAQILVVPDLEAGNMLATNLIYLAKADSAGLVLGARVPVVLTSRADSVRSRMASCAVAVLFAAARRRAATLPAA